MVINLFIGMVIKLFIIIFIHGAETLSCIIRTHIVLLRYSKIRVPFPA